MHNSFKCHIKTEGSLRFLFIKLNNMKSKVLILGANGSIAQHAIEVLQNKENIDLYLSARSTDTLKSFSNDNTQILKVDVLNKEELTNSIKGKDIVYANLAGPVDKMAQGIVDAMQDNGVKRLIFITALGIYNEIPGKFGEWNEQMIGDELVRYRKAADSIEASNLDYTIVRPAWLTNKDEVNFETTQKGEDFKGTEVSRKSVGNYVADIILHPKKDSKSSVGIDKPGSDGDKPSFY